MKSSPLERSTAEPLPFDVAPASRLFGLSRLTSLWTLYVLTLRQHLHGKRWIVMAGMFLLCAGLVVLVRATSPDVPLVTLEFVFVFLFIPQAILPLLALVYASGIVRDEQEEQTMTYLLIRPIAKWALYAVKLLATLTTTVVLAAALTALIYAAIYVGAEPAGENVPRRCLQAASIHALAVVAYCCLFGLISVFTKRALIVGVLYALVFEGLFANMPFSIRLATVIYYTRLIAYRTLTFSTSALRGTPANHWLETHDIAAEFWQFDVNRDPGLLEHPQIRACVNVLLVSSLVCTVLAAFVFSQREFHVKTPEKA
jgi:ABC-2 type transport system permease protein